MNVGWLFLVGLLSAACAGVAGDPPRPGRETGGSGGTDPTGGEGGSGGSAGSSAGASGSGAAGGKGGTGGAAGVGGAGGSSGAGGSNPTGGRDGSAGTGGTGGNGGVADSGAIVDAGGKGGTGGSGTGGSGGTGPLCDADIGIATPVPDSPAKCTSGRRWTSGNGPTMSPGDICQGCHGFTISGTVYPTIHETGLCYGINGGAEVVVTPECGTPIRLEVNSAGNFYYMGSLRLPFTAKVVVNGKERVMVGPQTIGDCNACHTQNGLQGAPGRIIVP